MKTPRRSPAPKPAISRPARAADAATRRCLRLAATAGASKKALRPVLLDLRLLAGFTDYFYICHGANPKQVQAIAEAVEEQLRTRCHTRPAHFEGGQGGDWVVLDYLDFVVHIFSESSREFYGLERLWAKAPKLKLPAGLDETH